MTDELQTMADKLAALNAETAQLQAQIADKTAAERADALADIKQDIADFSIKPAELFSVAELRPADKSAKPAKASVKAVRAPKFRNNDTGLTWAGVGRQPVWLSKAIASGMTLDQYRIAA